MWFGWSEVSSKRDLSNFDCGNADLNAFLKNDALDYKTESLSNTILFFSKDKDVIGFATICTDAIRLDKRERGKMQGFELSDYPGVKIARLAVAKEKQSQGMGAQRFFSGCLIISNIMQMPSAPASSP